MVEDPSVETERDERKPAMKARLEEMLNKPLEKLEIEDEHEVEREDEKDSERA